MKGSQALGRRSFGISAGSGRSTLGVRRNATLVRDRSAQHMRMQLKSADIGPGATFGRSHCQIRPNSARIRPRLVESGIAQDWLSPVNMRVEFCQFGGEFGRNWTDADQVWDVFGSAQHISEMGHARMRVDTVQISPGKLGTIEGRLAWPLRRDGPHKSRRVHARNAPQWARLWRTQPHSARCRAMLDDIAASIQYFGAAE